MKKYKGASKHNEKFLNKPFMARIKVDGKIINLGYFKTARQAGLEYNKAVRRMKLKRKLNPE